MNDPGRSPSPASSTTPHITQQQSIQEKPSSSTHQQTHLKSDATRTPRLPRIPPMTSDHPRTMTLQELWDWQSAWHDKRRHPTTSEIDDWIECGRQLDDAISDTTMDWEEEEKNEEIMDTCPSPTQRDHPAWTPAYQARRDARKQPPSPPPTPPRLKGPRLYRQGHASLRSERRGFRIEKTKCESSGKVAPRRPITRTFGTQIVSLHHQRGKIKFWPTPWEYLILDYAKYLRDWVCLVLAHTLRFSQS